MVVLWLHSIEVYLFGLKTDIMNQHTFCITSTQRLERTWPNQILEVIFVPQSHQVAVTNGVSPQKHLKHREEDLSE
jgi:hypothetical protein